MVEETQILEKSSQIGRKFINSADISLESAYIVAAGDSR